uniref:Uncharacterized protein n=1 Tax=Rhizophora mucronata TaxID=61149 RepID=A0A2P2IIG3_RHIMU
MQMTPPTTLTMCPSCERVAVPPSASSTADPLSHRQLGSTQHSPVPINPRAPAAPVTHGPFDPIRPQL